jgi:hypothetical protein
MITRTIGWIWKRWGDWQSLVAILDAFDLKTWAVGVGGAIVTFLWGTLYNEMMPIQIYLYALTAGALIVVIVGVIRWILTSKPTAPAVAASSPGEPFPDWKLHDLFLHIDPMVFETDKKNLVGQDVKDKMATGRLKSWGRYIDGSRRQALAPIPVEFWQDASFTYMFPDNDSPGVWDARGAQGRDYADVQVNRAEAEAIWPKASGLVPLHQAATFLLGQVAGTALDRITRDKAPTEEQRLDRIGALIASRTDKLSVRKPGEQDRVMHNRRHMLYQFMADGARSIRTNSGQKEVVWTDPMIDRAELDRVVADVKKDADHMRL